MALFILGRLPLAAPGAAARYCDSRPLRASRETVPGRFIEARRQGRKIAIISIDDKEDSITNQKGQ
jgi:hypothetical protein